MNKLEFDKIIEKDPNKLNREDFGFPERTLLLGCDAVFNHIHVYINDDIIHCEVYNKNEKLLYYSMKTINLNNIFIDIFPKTDNYIDYSTFKISPECSDEFFIQKLKSKFKDIKFYQWNEIIWNKYKNHNYCCII